MIRQHRVIKQTPKLSLLRDEQIQMKNDKENLLSLLFCGRLPMNLVRHCSGHRASLNHPLMQAEGE